MGAFGRCRRSEGQGTEETGAGERRLPNSCGGNDDVSGLEVRSLESAFLGRQQKPRKPESVKAAWDVALLRWKTQGGDRTPGKVWLLGGFQKGLGLRPVHKDSPPPRSHWPRRPSMRLTQQIPRGRDVKA